IKRQTDWNECANRPRERSLTERNEPFRSLTALNPVEASIVGEEEAAVQDDRRLARRIQQGDRRAFEEFVDSYGARVHRLVRRYIHNPTDDEDSTQEIFFVLYRSIGG